MAVQKSRRTPRTRGNRRGHDKLKLATLSIDSETGETHLRHHMTPDGYYRGRQIVMPPSIPEVAEDE
jgi:large subunit ribosomal protein L32